MGLYELSIDPALVAEAERLTSHEALARREFPTLVMRWESKLFGQGWDTTLVLDYILALPPLEPSLTFIPVRLGAFVGNVPTKYLYFGTEMNDGVPRVGPEMENVATPQHGYQEFQIDERSCPIPYLKLIQATPRIYGNAAQDYYAPPIKVERYDAVASTTEHLADLFAEQVANLPQIPGSMLTDPQGGAWEGSRFAGIRAVAIVRQGKVVGLHRKQGRADKEVAPPSVSRRSPHLDLRSEWVAIDIGARSVVVATRGDRSNPELVRIGSKEPVKRPAEWESPSEVSFVHLRNTLKAWRERVIQPHTRYDDVRVGVASAALRAVEGGDVVRRAASTITELPFVRDWTDAKRPFALRGFDDPDATEVLKKPAPPVIDEEGIGAHDPFDPIELYGYQIGLHVNHRLRGLHTRYVVSMPTGWSPDRRRDVLVALRRGLFRSLPAGMLEYHELDKLIVADAGPTSICYLAYAHRAFAAQPKDGPVNFAVFEAGASEAGLAFGLMREPTSDERKDGLSMVIEHLDTVSIPWFGGERLLHSLAYQVYCEHLSDAMALGLPFDLPPGHPPVQGAESMFEPSPIGRANAYLLKEALRPLFEGDPTYRLPTSVRLGSADGASHELRLALNRAALKQLVESWFAAATNEFVHHLHSALQRLARGSDPFEGLRVFLAGRMTMNTTLQEVVARSLPSSVRLHRFREPDRTNLQAATVKTAVALGALSLRIDKVGVMKRAEQRDAFRHRVGRARHGQLIDVLDPSVEYDAWRELGPCTKPTVELLFMGADYDGEVASDDPRVIRVEVEVGADGVGRRLFLRAVSATRVEVGLGLPGEPPDAEGRRAAVDLSTGMAFPL
jgi:hypothetical protein